jgi:DNA-binding MarR family transcriptional regulator
MSQLSGWPLVTTVTNILSFVTWGFPLLALAVLSYCIEYYTSFKTHWRLYVIATLLALIYPLGTSIDYFIHGDTVPEHMLFVNTLLLSGLLIGSYASIQLLKFQKISLGKTRHTVQILSAVGMAFPTIAAFTHKISYLVLWQLIAYNLSVCAMIFIFLAIGKLTQNYIPHYRLLAYSSARLGSILLMVDPILTNYVYIAGLSLAVKYGMRLISVLTQCFAILLLLVTVVMLILEAQARGVHLIPRDEKRNKKPMRYRLKKGYSYLIQEELPSHSTEVFMEFVTHQHHGLMLTRVKPSRIRQSYGLATTPILWMTNAETDDKSVKPKDLDRILCIIKDFISFDTDSIILIQRLDYLITENDFNMVLKLLNNLNDLIMQSKSILIVSLDPLTLSGEKLALLMQELKDLTQSDEITLGEPLYSVLLFVYSENKHRKTPSFKSITQKFSITKTTARKRIYELEGKGLLKILKQGRYKFLEVTEKGSNIMRSPVSFTRGDGNE